MSSHDIQFDEAAYSVDVARARGRDDDASGVLAAVREVLLAVSGASYAGLLAEASAAAADAVESAHAGDRERTDAALVLLAHLIADMEAFERAESARLLVE